MTGAPEKIWPSTTISSLELPHWELLLSEGLGLFPTKADEASKTIAEQALELGLKPSELVRRLEDLRKLVDGIELTERQFTKHFDATHILVVGKREGWWTRLQRPTKYLNDMPLAQMMDWKKERVICVGHQESDCVSAALFLRQHEFRKVYVYADRSHQ